MSVDEILSDLRSRCRICLERPGSVDIFSTQDMVENILLSTGVHVKQDERLPPSVCRACEQVLRKVVPLRSRAVASQHRLLLLVQPETWHTVFPVECTPDMTEMTEETEETEEYDHSRVSSSDLGDIWTNEQHQTVQTFESLDEFSRVVQPIMPISKKRKRLEDVNTNSNIARVQGQMRETHQRETHQGECHRQSSVPSNDLKCEIKEELFDDISEIMRKLPKKYVCEVCSRRYQTRKSLYNHKLYHEAVRRFPCERCEKGFTTRGDLKKHHLVHTGERPFHCLLCQSCFTQRGSLKAHVKRYHPDSIT